MATTNEAISIFVSHASSDRELVECFVKALESFVVIPEGALRCTSLTGYRPRTEPPTGNTLRQELGRVSVIVGILTQDGLASGRGAFELGAGWATDKWIAPVLAGVDYDELPGPLKEGCSADATSRDELEELFREIAGRLKYRLRAPSAKSAEAMESLLEAADAYFEEEEEDEEDEEGEEDEESEEEDEEE